MTFLKREFQNSTWFFFLNICFFSSKLKSYINLYSEVNIHPLKDMYHFECVKYLGVFEPLVIKIQATSVKRHIHYPNIQPKVLYHFQIS